MYKPETYFSIYTYIVLIFGKIKRLFIKNKGKS